jgi:hypothetical protein
MGQQSDMGEDNPESDQHGSQSKSSPGSQGGQGGASR